MSVWLTSVDLPLPETPVTQTKPPSGNFTSTFLRLFSLQPLSSRQFFSGSTGRRCSGVWMASSPVRYLRVVDSNCDVVVAAADRPPLRPFFVGGGLSRSETLPVT